MVFKDISQLLSPQNCFIPAVCTQALNPAAITIDLGGYSACVLYILTGPGGITFTSSNKIDWVIQYSDNSDFSSPAYVAAADVRCSKASWTLGASGNVYSIQAAHAATDILEVGYIGGHRYLQCIPTFGGTHATGTLVAAIAICGRPYRGPVS